MNLRLIDAGVTSCSDSQTIYHAVARAKTESTLDTIVLVTPAEPYICIGYHQELEKEVDLEFCKEHGIPVIRREVGGGVVYLDSNQLFTQWIFHPDRLPWRLERRFEIFTRPIINTYRAIGIEAYFHPPNDIHVSVKKIGGLGAGAIGNAEVVVGNFLFDFDFELMSNVLKVPNREFREKVFQSLQKYLTTVKKELGKIPNQEQVKRIYLAECEKTLNAEIEIGQLSPLELETIARLDARFASDSWLFQKSGLSRPGIKIHSDVWLYQNHYKAEGGPIRATLRVRDNRIDDISLSADFPKTEKLENYLLHKDMIYENLLKTIEQFYCEEEVKNEGVSSRDWVNALLMHQASTQN